MVVGAETETLGEKAVSISDGNAEARKQRETEYKVSNGRGSKNREKLIHYNGGTAAI